MWSRSILLKRLIFHDTITDRKLDFRRDRTIAEYAEDIWKLPAVAIN